VLSVVPTWTAAEKKNFLESTSRLERYRFAGKTLKFKIYLGIELMMVALSLAVVGSFWARAAVPSDAMIAATSVIGALGALHHLKLVARMPWVITTAAVEGGLLWAIYHWVISRWIPIPGVWALCVIVAVARYWSRAEVLIEERAYSAVTQAPSNTSLERTREG
jgi:hypothetical protein